MNSKTRPRWLLVAGTTRARILQQLPGVAMEIIGSFIHPHAAAPVGNAALDARQNELARFAQELARYLEGEARSEAFGSLVMVAPMPMLDHLQGALGRLTQPRIVGAVERDLTSCGVAELGRLVERELTAATPC